MAESDSNTTNECIVCCKNIDVYAVGVCNHPVCYECIVRMRVLCDQKECPICRKKLEKVLLTCELTLYETFVRKLKELAFNEKYGVYFENADIKNMFFKTFENSCSVCKKVTFHDFEALQLHMRKQHDLYFCDLCVENIKLFPSERKLYNRQEYAFHRRKGDKDSKSHKGHPLCEFCDERFFDKDALYKHLRTQHYFCHICDGFGSLEFYGELSALSDHFRTDHFLCEEGQCANDPLTSVYRTALDLKAHQATRHNPNKFQSKQLRNVEVDYPSIRGGRGHHSHRQNNRHHEEPPEEPNPQPRVHSVDTSNENDFPTLGSGNNVAQAQVPQKGNAKEKPEKPLARNFGRSALEVTNENFPALGGTSSALSNSNGGSKKSQPTNQPVLAISRAPPPSFTAAASSPIATRPMVSQTRPTVSHAQPTKKPVKLKQERENINLTPLEDFPSLPKSSSSGKQNKLIANSLNFSSIMVAPPKVQVVKPPEPPPSAKKIKENKPKPNLNSADAFPLLEKKKHPIKNGLQGGVTNSWNRLNGPLSGSNNINGLNSALFLQPRDSKLRNKVLKDKIAVILANDEAYNEFQRASKSFLKSQFSPSTYYEHCRMVLGESFIALFPELIALMPDINKQQDLHEIIRKSNSKESKRLLSRLSICNDCKQLLITADVEYHAKQHEMGDTI